MQIERYLKDLIERGRLAEGEYVPAEKELAARFGVSLGTVKKAMRRLKEDGYVERRKGHGTRVVRSTATSVKDQNSIVVLLGRVRRSFYAEIYSGIQGELDDRDYKPILIETRDLSKPERRAILKHREQVGGFLVVPASDNTNQALYGQLLAEEIPFVFMDRYLPQFNVDAVVSDNVQGGYLATRCLLEFGHRRIAVVGLTGVVSLKDRLAGYRRALEEFEVPCDEDLLYPRQSTAFEDGYRIAGRILEEHSEVTAAFCLRDDAAWGTLRALSDAGVRVPEEFSVIGYDDNEDICSRLTPPLTTVRQPKPEIGAEAAKRLMRKVEGREIEGPKVLHLPVELVRRESAGPAPEEGTKRDRRKAGADVEEELQATESVSER